ncbi:MAG: hypothetical protein V3T40_01005 [Nitrososphaerales archaeon]
MSIQIANNALENCISIDQVVSLINDDAATDATSEMVASAYAINAAEEEGYGSSDENLEAHLDVLTEAGADFDYSDAMKQAVASKKQ